MSHPHLLHLDTGSDLKSKASTLQELQLQSVNHRPKGQPLWFPELQRLQHLEQDFAFIPVGWGNGKGPMFFGKNHETTPEDWTKQALTVEQLLAWQRTPYRGVGARTGLHAGRLLTFDFDGESSVEFGCQLGLEPWGFETWHTHRDDNPWRFKVHTQPTFEQLAQLPVGPDGGIEFQGSVGTKSSPEGSKDKGEALEVFFAGGRQVILIGQHPDGGNYIWPSGLGPEALAPPPQAWLDYAIHIAKKFHAPTRSTSSRASSSAKNGTRRLNPCHICGRNNSGSNDLWCDETTKGLVFCMEGSTFSAEQAHGRLTEKQIIQTAKGPYKFLYAKNSTQGNAFVFAPVTEGN